jgi:hypothetical protein
LTSGLDNDQTPAIINEQANEPEYNGNPNALKAQCVWFSKTPIFAGFFDLR